VLNTTTRWCIESIQMPIAASPESAILVSISVRFRLYIVKRHLLEVREEG